MERKQFALVVLFVAVLLMVAFAPLSGQQGSGAYDPWLDYNEDGVIDVNDLHPLGGSYGTTGDSTKNVTVTNWPVEPQPFPENLVLKGMRVVPATMDPGSYRRDLIDATTYHPPTYWPSWVTESEWFGEPYLNSTVKLLFNATYVHQKISVEPYRILGLPTVAIPINVSNDPGAFFQLDFRVHLGLVSMMGEWVELAFVGNNTLYLNGKFYDDQFVIIISRPTDEPINMIVEPSWRLAVRVVTYGSTMPPSADTGVGITIIYDPEAKYQFTVDIPIVKHP